MPWTLEHIKWFVDTGERLKTADGKTIEIWEFRHKKDDVVLSAWAKHFRNHYCLDTEIGPMVRELLHTLLIAPLAFRLAKQ